MKESLHHFDFIRLNELIAGVLYGSLATDLPHTAVCLRHPRNIWERFGGAMSELNFDTLNGMVKTVKDIGSIICHLTSELEGCWVTEADKTDLARLKAMTSAFFSPWEFSFNHEDYDLEVHRHLIINGQDVLDELMDAKVHWDHFNYYEFGYSLGYALDQILLQQRKENKLPAGWRENSL